MNSNSDSPIYLIAKAKTIDYVLTHSYIIELN